MRKAHRLLYSVVYLEVYTYLCRIETFARTEDVSDPCIFRYSEVLPKQNVPVVPSLYLTTSRCSQQFCMSNRSVNSEVTPRICICMCLSQFHKRKHSQLLL
jgi:hypothetical protein